MSRTPARHAPFRSQDRRAVEKRADHPGRGESSAARLGSLRVVALLNEPGEELLGRDNIVGGPSHLFGPASPGQVDYGERSLRPLGKQGRDNVVAASAPAEDDWRQPAKRVIGSEFAIELLLQAAAWRDGLPCVTPHSDGRVRRLPPSLGRRIRVPCGLLREADGIPNPVERASLEDVEPKQAKQSNDRQHVSEVLEGEQVTEGPALASEIDQEPTGCEEGDDGERAQGRAAHRQSPSGLARGPGRHGADLPSRAT